MAITDSGTTLNTSWTEQSIVAFTAGTIADIDDMVAEVQSKLKRGTLSTTTSPTLADVQRWLVRAKQELMQVKRYTFSRRYAYADSSGDDYRFSLPPDFGGGAISLRDTTNNRSLKPWPANRYDEKYPDPSEEDSGEPSVYCIKNMELWLMPPCDGVVRLELEYDRTGEDNTATDFSFLPEIERFRCADYALYESCEALQDWERTQWFKAKWQEGLARSVKANARRRWSDMNFRAVSMLEEDAARQHQP